MPLGQITALDFFCQKDSRKNGADYLTERLTDHEVCRHSTVRGRQTRSDPWRPEGVDAGKRARAERIRLARRKLR